MHRFWGLGHGCLWGPLLNRHRGYDNGSYHKVGTGEGELTPPGRFHQRNELAWVCRAEWRRLDQAERWWGGLPPSWQKNDFQLIRAYGCFLFALLSSRLLPALVWARLGTAHGGHWQAGMTRRHWEWKRRKGRTERRKGKDGTTRDCP